MAKESAEELLALADIANEAGEDEQAQEYLRRAVEVAPKAEEAWVQLGRMSTTRGEKLRCFRKAVALNPDNREAKRVIERIETQEVVTEGRSLDKGKALGAGGVQRLREREMAHSTIQQRARRWDEIKQEQAKDPERSAESSSGSGAWIWLIILILFALLMIFGLPWLLERIVSMPVGRAMRGPVADSIAWISIL